jgi:hypothetical protein
MAMDQPRPAPSGLSVDDATAGNGADAWCTTLRSRPICFGEPD